MSSIPSFDSGRVARYHFQPVEDVAFDGSVVHCMAAGTITVVPLDNTDGEALDYDVLQGQTLPILVRKVTALSNGLTIEKVRCWR